MGKNLHTSRSPDRCNAAVRSRWVGLSMDYEVLMLSRVREEYAPGETPWQSLALWRKRDG